MKKIFFLIYFGLLISSCQEKEEKKPNFVFILVDDLGWADVKANYPETFYETPHLDQMAAEGMRFTQAYAAHPVCSPTRAALMTGKHPNRLGITDWIPGFDKFEEKRPISTPAIRDELALEETTLAEKFKGNGYKTFFIGKWHLGEEEKYWPQHQGFDINIGGWRVGAPQLKEGVSNGYYSPYGNPKLPDGPEGEYLTDRLTNESLQLIRENSDEPFLLYLSFYSVHTPIQPAPKRHDYFINKKESINLAEGQAAYRQEGDGQTKLVQDNAAYASMVAAMDENVGKILKELKDKGLDDNTWVILTSDNGGLSTLYGEGAPTANGPLRAGKGWCYEGGIRVPLIIKGPGIKTPGKVTDLPVVSMDFFPTLLSIAGASFDETDGKDLSPFLRGGEAPERDVLFWHYPQYHGSAWKPGSAIREGDWKLIHDYESGENKLFNLENDPGEKEDLANSMPDKAIALHGKLMMELKKTGGKFPTNK
ncbi:sulfatase [Cyclobacterium qasimii]|nr:sulfatase [Cyclobacterium qasimii]GEO22564.1 sulfatase [Cyclobacterium qasimii]